MQKHVCVRQLLDPFSGSPHNALHSLVSIVVSYVDVVYRKVWNFQSLPVTAYMIMYTLQLPAEFVLCIIIV